MTLHRATSFLFCVAPTFDLIVPVPFLRTVSFASQRVGVTGRGAREACRAGPAGSGVGGVRTSNHIFEIHARMCACAHTCWIPFFLHVHARILVRMWRSGTPTSRSFRG